MTDMVVTRTGNRTQKRTTPLFVQTLERDQVFVFGSPYDPTRGLITRRT